MVLIHNPVCVLCAMVMITALSCSAADTDTNVTLSNPVAEAAFGVKPYPRVLTFRMKDGTSPLRQAEDDPFVGIRTWYMTPEPDKMAMLPCRQPAALTRFGERSVQLIAEPEPESGLQLILDIHLDDARPVLTIRHGLKNLGPEPRRLALWPIMAFPYAGVGIIPWGSQPTRSLHYYFRTAPTEPAVKLGNRFIAVDFRIPVQGRSIKVGTHTDAEWAAYLWSGGTLRSRVAYTPGATYPDGGSTVTLYKSGPTMARELCEVEHVGPLTDVPPAGVLWLTQTVELLPDVTLDGDTPDDWGRRLLDE